MKNASIASVRVSDIDGMTVSMARLPPNSALTSLLDGMAPNTTSNAVGRTMLISGPISSRTESFSSTTVSLVRAVMVVPPSREVVSR